MEEVSLPSVLAVWAAWEGCERPKKVQPLCYVFVVVISASICTRITTGEVASRIYGLIKQHTNPANRSPPPPRRMIPPTLAGWVPARRPPPSRDFKKSYIGPKSISMSARRTTRSSSCAATSPPMSAWSRPGSSTYPRAANRLPAESSIQYAINLPSRVISSGWPDPGSKARTHPPATCLPPLRDPGVEPPLHNHNPNVDSCSQSPPPGRGVPPSTHPEDLERHVSPTPAELIVIEPSEQEQRYRTKVPRLSVTPGSTSLGTFVAALEFCSSKVYLIFRFELASGLKNVFQTSMIQNYLIDWIDKL